MIDEARPEAHLERETKLTPWPGFEITDLDGLLPEWTAQPLPALDLTATYFDTHTLTLARAGITVRHRTGDGPPTWTVKLPSSEGGGGGATVRQELDIEGERNPRPRAVRFAVDAHLRGRRLLPVAEIRTARTRLVIQDGSGRPLVEVAHDRVSATRGRRPLGSWEEVEVEAIGEDGAPAQHAVARSLRDAGCKKAGTTPKLIRALGDDATAPTEVTVPRLPKHPSAVDALEQALARSVHQVLAHDPGVRVGGDPEDLHQLRVATRRLRSDLHTFRDFFDRDTADRVRGELRWVTHQTNQLRDLDVLRAWLQGKAPSLADDDQGAVDALIQRCEDQAGAQRAALLRSLGSPRYAALIHDLVQLAETPPEVPKKAQRRARMHLDQQVRRRWKELRSQVEALGDEPTDHDLHQARIAAKRCRAAVEATKPLAGRGATRLAKSLAALQDVLGAVHDASVIEAWLREAAGSAAAFTAGELAAMADADGRAHAARWPDAWAKVKRHHRAM